MNCMSVTLEVSKLSGWLNADAYCRESNGGHTVRGEGAGQLGAHLEHVAHVRDAGGIPVGNVRIEILQIVEEVAHVRDGRDAPVGDGSVLRNGARPERQQRIG
eukprot:scaffold65681_cov57-Phaeocystis_antarctica.AAC.1